MNNIAISPYFGMHLLQIQNVKRDTTKKVNVNDNPISNNNKESDIVDIITNEHDDQPELDTTITPEPEPANLYN
jgi:hypothetical protein